MATKPKGKGKPGGGAMKKCPSCGYKVPAKAARCPHCGAKL